MPMEPSDTFDNSVAGKRARLRSMQRMATLLLVLMLVLLAVSVSFRDAHPIMQWLQAFATAASVGAIADWFAVVALFHHPLGLPLPHTSIVARNKDRIGESLGHFVEHNFLTVENVVRKIEQRNLSLAAADWITDEKHADQVARQLCAWVPGMLDALGDDDVRRLLSRAVRSQLDKLDTAKIAASILTVLTAGGRHQAILDRGLHALENFLVANQAAITAKFGDSSKYTPRVFDAYIVRKFVAGVIGLMHEIVETPDHEIRQQFDAAIRDFVVRPETQATYREQADALKAEFLAHLESEGYYAVVWGDLKARLEADIEAEESTLRAHLRDVLQKLGAGLREDQLLQSKINAWALTVVETLLVRHRHQVSGLITEVVKGWDARELSEKMELEMGRDLQYIRINGTLVGGLVGVLLHAATGLI